MSFVYTLYTFATFIFCCTEKKAFKAHRVSHLTPQFVSGVSGQFQRHRDTMTSSLRITHDAAAVEWAFGEGYIWILNIFYFLIWPSTYFSLSFVLSFIDFFSFFPFFYTKTTTHTYTHNSHLSGALKR